ncbi:MAG: sialidase family protein, partial [Polyangiaceae bacterium]
MPPPPVGPGAMAPRLRALGSELLLTWIEPVASSNAQGRAKRHRVRFSRLAEATWTPATTISEGAEIVANWADAPSAMRGGDGALVASWAEKSGDKAYAYDVVLGRSVDGGASWKRLGLAHDDGTASEHGFVSLVPEANGVRAFWLDGRLTASKDAGGHAGSMTLRTGLVS